MNTIRLLPETGISLGDEMTVAGVRYRVVGLRQEPSDEADPVLGVEIGDPVVTLDLHPVGSAVGTPAALDWFREHETGA